MTDFLRDCVRLAIKQPAAKVKIERMPTRAEQRRQAQVLRQQLKQLDATEKQMKELLR